MHDWKFEVDDDIRRARTPSPELYTSPRAFELQRERVFARSWQWIDDRDLGSAPESIKPVRWLDELLGEPLVLTRDGTGRTRALSNVCTHRGALVCGEAKSSNVLHCPYHGRRFALDGRCLSMPDFEDVANFPGDEDHLAAIPTAELGPMFFAALDPAHGFDELAREFRERIAWLPLDAARFDAARSRDFEVRAHWALYVENFLEGFHIPFVHRALAAAVEYDSYRTELGRFSNLQIAHAKLGESSFDPPRTSADFAKRIAGYYAWLFPATMLNVYPWGVSLNVVQPLAIDRTRIRFRSYVWDPTKLARGAGADLATVEIEDERIVESVQAGLRARLRRRGRYAPTRETGVHHFHRLLARFLDG